MTNQVTLDDRGEIFVTSVARGDEAIAAVSSSSSTCGSDCGSSIRRLRIREVAIPSVPSIEELLAAR